MSLLLRFIQGSHLPTQGRVCGVAKAERPATVSMRACVDFSHTDEATSSRVCGLAF